MKHINLYAAIIYFGIFVFDKMTLRDQFAWGWFIFGLLMLAEWLRYNITTDIKDYIDKTKK